MASVIAHDNESLDSLLKRFSTKVEGEKVIHNFLRHQSFMSKSEQRKQKQRAAMKKIRKLERQRARRLEQK